MSTESVNLLKERVLRAAIVCVEELDQREGVAHTKGSRALVRAVKALQAETWRVDEAPALIEALVGFIKANHDDHPTHVQQRGELLRRAEAFIGQREVSDDTQPRNPPRRPNKLRPHPSVADR